MHGHSNNTWARRVLVYRERYFPSSSSPNPAAKKMPPIIATPQLRSENMVVAFPTLKNGYNIRNFPKPISHASSHRRGHAKGLVDPAKVIIHVVQRDGQSVIFQFLLESIGKPSKSPAAHAQRLILTLCVAVGNMLSI